MLFNVVYILVININIYNYKYNYFYYREYGFRFQMTGVVWHNKMHYVVGKFNYCSMIELAFKNNSGKKN